MARPILARTAKLFRSRHRRASEQAEPSSSSVPLDVALSVISPDEYGLSALAERSQLFSGQALRGCDLRCGFFVHASERSDRRWRFIPLADCSLNLVFIAVCIEQNVINLVPVGDYFRFSILPAATNHHRHRPRNSPKGRYPQAVAAAQRLLRRVGTAPSPWEFRDTRRLRF